MSSFRLSSSSSSSSDLGRFRVDSPRAGSTVTRTYQGSLPLGAVLLLAIATIPADHLPRLAERARATLLDDQPNRGDRLAMEHGYYEPLSNLNRQLDRSSDWEGSWGAGSPTPAPFGHGDLTLTVDDVRDYVLKPNLRTTHLNAHWSTNSIGMRDREYLPTKPSGTLRIALLGDSITTGWGVDDQLNFESLWERSLTDYQRERRRGAVEILNYSVPGHAPGQRWEHFQRLGWSYQPDVLVYEATPADPGWDERRLRVLLTMGKGWDSPCYQSVLSAANALTADNPDQLKAKFKRYRWAMLEAVYRSIVRECRARGIQPAWFLIPRLGKDSDPSETARLIELAKQCGFDPVWDLSLVFASESSASLAIGPADYHPNARGHELLAQRLFTLATTPGKGKASVCWLDGITRGARAVPSPEHAHARDGTLAPESSEFVSPSRLNPVSREASPR